MRATLTVSPQVRLNVMISKYKTITLLVIILNTLSFSVHSEESFCEHFKGMLYEPNEINNDSFVNYCQFLVSVDHLKNIIIKKYGIETWNKLDGYDPKKHIPIHRGQNYILFTFSINGVAKLIDFLNLNNIDNSLNRLSYGGWSGR